MIHLNSEPHLPQSQNLSYIWPIIWNAVQICCISNTFGVTERFIFASVLRGKRVQSSAQTEHAAQMQGWMNAQWRPPEEDLQDDVSRKVPLPHDAASSDEAASNAGVPPHVVHPAIYRLRNAIIFNLKRELNTLAGERNKITARSSNTVAWRNTLLSLMGGFPPGMIHSFSLFLCEKKIKDAGMRLIQHGKVSGHCSERPINELINASSLIRGCQPPLALLFNTCYCFHGNWYSHPRPHINIQLHLIWQLSGGC